MRSKGNSQNRFMRIITIPIRALCKARDYYVRSITECASTASYGGMVAGPGGHDGMPRSFSVNSSRSNDSDDFAELIRAASTTSLRGRTELDLFIQEQLRQAAEAAAAKKNAMPRSCSVGMGRIDEDAPCEFGEEKLGAKAELVYPRSKSYAVGKRAHALF